MPTDPKYLRDFNCFRDLTDDQLGSLAQITNAVCYPPGYTLLEEGKTGDRLFFLIKGEVEVLYNLGETGQVHVDNVLGEEIVGCSALIEPYVYTATERSLTEVEVFEVQIVPLRELMQIDCCLGYKLQQLIVSVLMDRILNLRL